MTLFVEPDASVVTELEAALGKRANQCDTLEQARDEVSVGAAEDVVVLGPNIDPMGAFRLASDYRITRPTLSVIMVRRRVEKAFLGEAMRHGVREVVETHDLRGLNDAVLRAQALASDLHLVGEGPEAAADQERGLVITVFSAKGGCGKTTMSTNLAAMLAAEGGKQVCLVDLDLAFGDVSIGLQLVPAHTVIDAIAMGPTLDADGLRDLLTPHASGLQVLAAPIGPDAKDAIRPDLVSRMVDLLAHEFEVVVVDTPPAFDDTTLAAFDHTDLLLVLTTLDVPAVKNLKLALDTLHLINFPPDRVKVVLNRADSRVGLTAGDVEKAIKVPLAAKIPSSRDIPSSTNRGVALALDNPKHPVTQSIRTFAREHLPQVSEQLVDPAAGKRRSLMRPRGES